VTVSAAFGCPFEGEVPSRASSRSRRVAAGQPHEIAFADTIGVGVPSQVTDLVGRAREALPGMRCAATSTTPATPARQRLRRRRGGRGALDASIGGIGGCPFAPAATGNIPTEDLVYMLHRMGVTTGVDLDKLIETAAGCRTSSVARYPACSSRRAASRGPASRRPRPSRRSRHRSQTLRSRPRPRFPAGRYFGPRSRASTSIRPQIQGVACHIDWV
jgi:hypothetical protein